MRSIKNDAKAHHQMGNVFLQNEEFSAAIEAYQKALAICPDSCATHFRLGLAYFSIKAFTQAKAAFQKVLSLDHKHPNVNQCLANALLELGDFDTAIHYYFRQMEINPWPETYYNLGVLFMMKNRFDDALLYFHQAEKINPTDPAIYQNKGHIYLKKNQLKDAATAYQKANELKPDDTEIQYILSAIEQRETPPSAPPEFVEHLFDQYAPYYDQHLTSALQYTLPNQMRLMLESIDPYFSQKKYRILDLGCGSGLCGSVFKPYATHLTGVDLSSNMIAIAKEKGCYDLLLTESITTSLSSIKEVDLILAADVFPYFGDLKPIFQNAYQALHKNGLFLFSVEKTHEFPFRLQPSVRYAHSRSYIEQLAKEHQFEVICLDMILLRKQKNTPVEGYLTLLKKTKLD